MFRSRNWLVAPETIVALGREMQCGHNVPFSERRNLPLERLHYSEPAGRATRTIRPCCRRSGIGIGEAATGGLRKCVLPANNNLWSQTYVGQRAFAR
ncbi:hypothetical protein BN2476_560127 [Paraburkholderia piptadeniae]|uniref:Uncharacterized protein n=1 Tax=Paraburkholderia piptadeniae TaxID=1701573 RepID=A0A1N7SIZ4_9BURK|nr:hypothetical protein BN2476_560127 [Paraburkholderia piptadeniae]